MSPPTMLYDSFRSYSPTLHVVKGYKDTYASTEYWSNFTNIVEDLISLYATKDGLYILWQSGTDIKGWRDALDAGVSGDFCPKKLDFATSLVFKIEVRGER